MSEEKQSNQIAQSITGFLDKHGVNLLNKVIRVYSKAYDEYRISWRVGYES